MRELRTEIDINAEPEKIWGILTDTENYSKWNPFIRKIDGELKLNNEIQVLLRQADAKEVVFKPRVMSFEENSEFSWLGKLLFDGLFKGHHIFELKKTGNGPTKFIHREQFQGALVPFMWHNLNKNTRMAFQEMNKALKTLAEEN